jgi:two-component system sensor histidine kinase/response regulator
MPATNPTRKPHGVLRSEPDAPPDRPSLAAEGESLVRTSPLPACSSPSPKDGGVRPSLSVLVADDTPANRRMIARVLQERGHRVTVVSDGRAALDRFVGDKFDVVLMDLQMPRMDGYQASAAIREFERTGQTHTPIIALTAEVWDAQRDQAWAAGVDAFLAKPLDVGRLVELVETAVQLAGAGDRGVGEGTDRDVPAEVKAAPLETSLDVAGVMRRLGGDLGLLQEFIRVFDEDAPGLVCAIQRGVAQGDAVAVQRAAHSLRGLAANFGARAAVEAATQLETLAHGGAVSEAASAAQRMADETARLQAALARFCGC